MFPQFLNLPKPNKLQAFKRTNYLLCKLHHNKTIIFKIEYICIDMDEIIQDDFVEKSFELVFFLMINCFI